MESQKEHPKYNLPQISRSSQGMPEPGLSSSDSGYSATYNTNAPEGRSLIQSTLDDSTNLRYNQQSEYSHGRAPLGAWSEDSSVLGAIVPPDSRLEQGSPTRRASAFNEDANASVMAGTETNTRESGTHLGLQTRSSGRGSGRKPALRKPDTSKLSKHPSKGNPRRQTTANPSRQQHPFLCTFHFANCQQTFATKNEWKRHVSSQHLQTTIWRCDYPSCSERKAATFNRKDLFGQHLKRMHAPSGERCGSQSTRSSINRKNRTPEMAHFLNTEIPRIQERCRKERRQPPQSMCGFPNCRQLFDGHESWEERIEHVGCHYENAAASGDNVGPENWVADPGLIDWAVREGLVIQSSDGSYKCTSVSKAAEMDAIAFQ